MVKGLQLAVLIFLITASMASIALGSKTSPYSIDFDLRNMDGFNDNLISAGDIEAFVKEKYPGSPMLDESDIGNCFINAGQENNVNPAFLVATACLEGGFGTLGWAQSHPECHNTFGYGIPSGTTQPDDYNCMDSWCVMIERVASVIAHGNIYYTKGLYTVSQVRGKYAASPNSDSIAGLMNELYAFSNLETATSNTVVEEPSFGIDQSQASSSLGLPLQVLSPVIGPLEIVSDINDCSGTKWCFNQHKTGNGGIGHIPGGGVGKADDTYAWDANLDTPQSDEDNGKAVYAIAQGVVCQTYGGKKNADDIGSYGQVLIEHSNQGTKWWSGYLHLANIRVKKGQAVSEDTILGEVSQVGADNNHLHFAVYTGENSEGKLKSFDTQIAPRSVSSSVEGDAQETSIKPPIVLTLYVHDGSADGPKLSEAEVTGHDAAGESFSQATDADGFVVITGSPGSWQFTVTKPGYDINSWSQEILETGTKHAYIFLETVPIKSVTENETQSTPQNVGPSSETSADGELGDLIDALKDSDADVRLKAAEALGKLADNRAVDPLIEVLRNDEDRDVRLKAAWALGEIGDARTVDPLSYASVKDADGYVREEAYKVLQKNTIGGNKNDTRSADLIIEALKDDDQGVRYRAAEALGQIKNAMAVDPLIEILRNDEDRDVRLKAAWALGEIGDTRTVDPLSYASVKDADGYVREEAYKVLQKNTVGGNKVDARSVDPIIGALEDGDQGVRYRAAEALGQIKNAMAVDPLIEVLRNDEDRDVRLKAAWALGEIDDTRTIDSLSYASVKDADGYVREEAYKVLQKNTVGGNKVDARSVDPIIGALEDGDQGVRYRAAEALGQIKNVTAVDPLIEVLGNDEDRDVRLKAAWALGEIDDARAVDPLSYASAKDADGYVRDEAKKALGKLGVQVE